MPRGKHHKRAGLRRAQRHQSVVEALTSKLESEASALSEAATALDEIDARMATLVALDRRVAESAREKDGSLREAIRRERARIADLARRHDDVCREMAQAVKTLPGLTGLEQLEIAAGLADGNDVLITAGVVIKSGMTREVVEAIQRSRGVRRGDR